MQMQEKKVKGFSLLELLVVVAIIGALSAVSFKPFMNWRTDRIVRTEALNVTAVIQNIFSQVQRGKYSFVQFKIEKDGNQYSVSSNGMEIEKFTDYVRDKYDGSTLKNFHKFETRCGMTFTWDDEGAVDEDLLTVNEIFIDATSVGLGVEGSDISTGGGTVCFSKDGTYYSPAGVFLDGTTPIERLFICTPTGIGSGCLIEGENTFALEWSRFGNITLKKYSEKNGWVIQ